MKSRAHIKGHPIHPMLVPFPIAFFTGTLLFDIIGIIYQLPVFLITASFMAITGICFAVITAIPGLVDYILTVPPQSSAKKRATRHGLLNITVLIIFAAAVLLRQAQQASPGFVIGLEAVGVLLMGVAGWMGGTLVYRNQIGVNPRYAHAGKWKEERVAPSAEAIEVAAADELKVNQMKLLHIGNKRIVVCRTEHGYAAVDDRCPHKGGSLAGGAMICGTVQCPWHGSQFSVANGTVTAGPAEEKINVYPVTELNGNVFVTLASRQETARPYAKA